MPEGDTLFNIATQLRPALVGKTVRRAEFARLAGDAKVLVGTKVMAVEAQGKNLLVRFDNGLVLHTHLKMPGMWHLYRPGDSWKRAASAARAVLEVDGFQAVCFDAPVVRILRRENLKRDRQLNSLGPDLLAQHFDLPQALDGLREINHWPLGVAVMHQGAVAGIGNVYKSEVLFLEQLDPFIEVAMVSDEQLTSVLTRARELMQFNTTIEETPRLRSRITRKGGTSDSTKVWVYRRRGMPCFRCGDTIRMKRQGESLRSTYFCPTCQGISFEKLASLFGEKSAIRNES